MGILPNCKDPPLTALKAIGYNVVQLPCIDLRPTQLLVANGKNLQRSDELNSVVSPGSDCAMAEVDRRGL